MNKAEELIACLEGEIAKRDARIVELESAAESLRLSRDYHHEQEIEYRRRWAGICTAQVSEANAQGVVLDGSQLAGLLEQVRLDDDEAKPHGSGATYWNNAVIACQVAIRDALADHAQQVSVPDGWKLVPVERITIALESVQNAMEDAYNNAYQECCGRGQGQCCGDPVAAWSDADTAIMDALAPAQRELSALLAAAPAAPEQ